MPHFDVKCRCSDCKHKMEYPTIFECVNPGILSPRNLVPGKIGTAKLV